MTNAQRFFMMDAYINNTIATAKALNISNPVYSAFLVWIKGMRTSYYEDYNTNPDGEVEDESTSNT